MNAELKQAVEKAAEQHSIRKDNEAEAQDGFIAGAEFMFSLLSKPSERPNIKDYLGDSAGLNDVHEQIMAAPRIYAYMQALDAYIDGLFAVPGKEANPSENAGQVSEELVEQIDDIITDAFITDEEEESLLISYPEYHFKADELNSVCLKIAKLLQSSSCCQENDGELLGAAEKILHLHLCEQEGIGAGQPSPTDWLNAVDALSDAINNVKNQ